MTTKDSLARTYIGCTTRWQITINWNTKNFKRLSATKKYARSWPLCNHRSRPGSSFQKKSASCRELCRKESCWEEPCLIERSWRRIQKKSYCRRWTVQALNWSTTKSPSKLTVATSAQFSPNIRLSNTQTITYLSTPNTATSLSASATKNSKNQQMRSTIYTTASTP